MKYAGRLRKILNDSIDRICSQRDKYFVSPDKDFTRKGKFLPQDIFKSLLTMEGTALSHEILSYFDFDPKSPTSSAFVQCRAKIKSEAFYDLFHDFTSLSSKNKLFKGYRLLSADGSDLHIPTNPEDKGSFHQNTKGTKPYNLLHLNALYDLMNHTYTDAVIQRRFHMNEHSALIDMAGKHADDPVRSIFIADRGYESYNNMAHITELGEKFLIRIRDSKVGCMLSGLDLPDKEYDLSFTFRLVCSQSNKIINMTKTDKSVKFIPSSATFDYLPRKREKHDPSIYELPIRVVRFKISDDTYEVVATNLPDNEFSPSDLKRLYAIRWGIETSFRDLKYTVGLLYFHAKKTESILQEIFARLIMYNFSQLVTSHVTIRNGKRKHLYNVNFSQAVHICRNFLLRRIPPSDVEVLIAKHILPFRPGRRRPRVLSHKNAAYFIYRVA